MLHFDRRLKYDGVQSRRNQLWNFVLKEYSAWIVKKTNHFWLVQIADEQPGGGFNYRTGVNKVLRWYTPSIIHLFKRQIDIRNIFDKKKFH